MNVAQPAVEFPSQPVAEFCRRNRIRRLSLFGSVLRADFRPDSDVDVLVEFEPEARVGFFKLVDLQDELSTMIGGRAVDLRTARDLSRYFRSEVEVGARVQYASDTAK